MRRVLALVLGLAMVATAPAQSEEDLRAAILANLVRFVTFPESALAGKDEFTFGVLGSEAFASTLERALADRKVMDRRVRVRAVRDLNVKDYDVIYLAPAFTDRLPSLQPALRRQTTLVITESPSALDRGAAINLRLRDGRFTFEISQVNARAAKIEISSRLLSLATRVVQ